MSFILKILCMFYAQSKKGEIMGKVETVAAQKAAIIAGEDAALEAGLSAVYDQAAMDQKGMDGTLNQADLDAAVAKVKADDAVAMTAAVKVVQDQLDALTASHAELVASDAALAAKESGEAAQIVELSAKAAITETLKSSLVQMQSGLDALKALISPAA